MYSMWNFLWFQLCESIEQPHYDEQKWKKFSGKKHVIDMWKLNC